MRQVPLSPLSFDPQRVANVPEHPPPSTRLRSCAHIANRRLSRIIGARLSNSLDILLPRTSSEPPPLPSVACCAHQVQNFDLSQTFWCGGVRVLVRGRPLLGQAECHPLFGSYRRQQVTSASYQRNCHNMASRIATRAVIKLISAHKLSFRLSPLLSICMAMTSPTEASPHA